MMMKAVKYYVQCFTEFCYSFDKNFGLMIGIIADNELTALTKHYQMVFRVWILLFKHVGCCDTCEKRKKKPREATRVLNHFES